MKLVELVRCITTSDETLQAGIDFGKSLKKLTVVTKDRTGFIVNRLLVPYTLDAIRAYEEGVGSIAEIDTAMQAGAGHPMGPLTLADFVGLDTLSAICDVMYKEFSEKRFAQPPLLRKMVTAGWHGRKTKLGFYDYSGEQPMVNGNL
jgi:3-hydroxybutyryl-CoA dehydrogenase